MSTFKKLLALTLALAMVLSVSAFAGNYKDNTYADAQLIDKDCEDSVELMYALDIMKGDDKGNFNPNATITRAEIAKMIYVILNYGKDDKAVTYVGGKLFSDVPAGAWYEGYVNYCGMTKLVQGRGDGTFGPNDPITAAAAAKMLLTAIGYSAEARNYVGAEWEKNVLADAAIIGLLDGYKYPTNTYAPRQWVAVMFENALYAYTYGTIRPVVFNGLLTGATVNINGKDDYLTMGEKYYDLNTYVGVLYATENAVIDQYKYDANDDGDYKDDDDIETEYAENGLIFSDGDSYIDVDNTNLGYMDLGQEYRVIYKDNGSVYSIKVTDSVVADALLYNVEVENSYATSKNDANNKYIFTVGDFEGKFESGKINYTGSTQFDGFTGKITFDTIAPVELRAAANDDDKTALEIRVVDTDNDEKIDYIIYTDYEYAVVTKTGEHKHYGEYFNAEDVDGDVAKPWLISNDKNWYIEDTILCDDEIEEGNYLKVTWNPDEQLFAVEVLPVAEEVLYEERTNKGVHTIAGEDYFIAYNGFDPEDVLVSANLDELLNIAVDGELVVVAKLFDSDLTDLAEINEKLVMVTEAYVDLYSNPNYNRYYVDYMTIDGEMHEEVRLYGDAKDDFVTYEMLVNDRDLDGTADKGFLGNNQRLFAFAESKDGVKLTRLMDKAGKDVSYDVLDYASSLLTGYREEVGEVDTKANEFDADKAGLEDAFIEEENLFFVSYGSKPKFAVMSLNDMGEGKDDAAFLQGLYKDSRSYDTYLAGHIYLPDLELKEATGYLYTTTADVKETGDGLKLYDVVMDGEELADPIMVVEIDGEDDVDVMEVKANSLYEYTYNLDKGEKEYYLTLIDETDVGTVEAGGKNIYFNSYLFKDEFKGDSNKAPEIIDVRDGDLVLKKADGSFMNIGIEDTIVLKTATLTLEETQNHLDDDLHFETEEVIEFVDADALVEALEAAQYGNGKDDDTFTFYTDLYNVEDEITYVVIYNVEIEAQAD